MLMEISANNRHHFDQAQKQTMVSWVFGFMVPVTFLAFLSVRFELEKYYNLDNAKV